MRILIGQPIHEEGIDGLTTAVETHQDIDMVLFPEGYLNNEDALREACELAKNTGIMIVSSSRVQSTESAIIIDWNGKIVYKRSKTDSDFHSRLTSPLVATLGGLSIGFLLCMEVLKGSRDLQPSLKLNFIVHPIGVGMYSEDQLNEWLGEAKVIAKMNKTVILGTSHWDGSYKNCGISIPIAYCIDSTGKSLFIAKSDKRTRIVDLETKTVTTLSE